MKCPLFLPILLAAMLASSLQAEEGETEGKEPAYLGITLARINTENRGGTGLEDGQSGLLVKEVDENGPAAKGGLKSGDVLMQVDGIPVTTEDQARKLVRRLMPAAEATLTVFRDGKKQVLTVIPVPAATLKQNPENIKVVNPKEFTRKLDLLREKSRALEMKRAGLRKRYAELGLSEAEAETRIKQELQPETEELRELQEDLQSGFVPQESKKPSQP